MPLRQWQKCGSDSKNLVIPPALADIDGPIGGARLRDPIRQPASQRLPDGTAEIAAVPQPAEWCRRSGPHGVSCKSRESSVRPELSRIGQAMDRDRLVGGRIVQGDDHGMWNSRFLNELDDLPNAFGTAGGEKILADENALPKPAMLAGLSLASHL
jgi:hypothetical protein